MEYCKDQYYCGMERYKVKRCLALLWKATSPSGKLIQQITVYDDHLAVRFKPGLEIDINE